MRKLIDCAACKTQTRNAKYCSRNCAATINNKLSKKRTKKEYRCRKCGVLLKIGWTSKVVCRDCNSNFKNWSLISIGELRANLSTSQFHARIRDLARREFKRSGKPQHCQLCKYKNHFEVCHIIPIANFPHEASVAEINAISNLAALCPNCHWDFDHGFVSL